MAAVAASRDRTEEALQRFLLLSLLLHGVLGAAAVVSAYFGRWGEDWGAPGGSVTVGLVGSMPEIPLPSPEVASPSRVVDTSKGLYKSEPQPKPQPEPEATPIPKFERNKPPKYVSRPSKILENPTPPPENAVPYGAGGAPTVPVTSFALGTGATQGGLAMHGVGGGDFATRFDYYVRAVQRRISEEWLQSTIDPNLSWAPRVVVTFDILRNGAIVNLQVTQSSNNQSVDRSAIRAVQSSNPLLALPPEYSGSRVSVEFYFDFRRGG